jgi:hypothetical protein
VGPVNGFISRRSHPSQVEGVQNGANNGDLLQGVHKSGLIQVDPTKGSTVSHRDILGFPSSRSHPRSSQQRVIFTGPVQGVYNKRSITEYPINWVPYRGKILGVKSREAFKGGPSMRPLEGGQTRGCPRRGPLQGLPFKGFPPAGILKGVISRASPPEDLQMVPSTVSSRWSSPVGPFRRSLPGGHLRGSPLLDRIEQTPWCVPLQGTPVGDSREGTPWRGPTGRNSLE